MPDNDDIPEMTDAQKARMKVARGAYDHAFGAVLRGEADDTVDASFQQFLQTGSVYAETRDLIRVPDDAGAFRGGLIRIMRRIPDGWGRAIGVEAGWYRLITDLDEALAQLDSFYEVSQVKQKFGGLCYRAYPSDGFTGDVTEFDRLIAETERQSWSTCEQCGQPGLLQETCRPGGPRSVRTLCPSCAASGDRLGRSYYPVPEEG